MPFSVGIVQIIMPARFDSGKTSGFDVKGGVPP
jgi:hypothetical protein